MPTTTPNRVFVMDDLTMLIWSNQAANLVGVGVEGGIGAGLVVPLLQPRDQAGQHLGGAWWVMASRWLHLPWRYQVVSARAQASWSHPAQPSTKGSPGMYPYLSE